MARARVRSYVDVIERHPELTSDELEELEQQLKKESENLTEWPAIY